MKKIGKRKCAIANVRIVTSESDLIKINNISDDIYFQKQSLLLSIIRSPLKKIQEENKNKYNIFINVKGGGIVAQAYAIRLGLARILSLPWWQVSDKRTSSALSTPFTGTINNESLVETTKNFTDEKQNHPNNLKNGYAHGSSKKFYIITPDDAKKNRSKFTKENYLTRDSRVKERRKYGLKKARKSSQFSKR